MIIWKVKWKVGGRGGDRGGGRGGFRGGRGGGGFRVSNYSEETWTSAWKNCEAIY